MPIRCAICNHWATPDYIYICEYCGDEICQDCMAPGTLWEDEGRQGGLCINCDDNGSEGDWEPEDNEEWNPDDEELRLEYTED